MEKLEKNDIRLFIKEKRKTLETTAESAWNDAICEQLLSLDDILRAFCVYCYVSFRREAGTWRFMEALLEQGKCVAVPKVVGKELEFYVITGKADLEEGIMGIMEPKPTCLKIHDPEAPVI
ncbi:MAG TPA: 5-formyltetrahydrofolate cyclo-ligase, partial [Lachnoclostridium sp.]|nr:5-formyltetrahydrofolate cyclo-ligase [Lachnoclostridium sp.]